jgi:hypothetical protein
MICDDTIVKRIVVSISGETDLLGRTLCLIPTFPSIAEKKRKAYCYQSNHKGWLIRHRR